MKFNATISKREDKRIDVVKGTMVDAFDFVISSKDEKSEKVSLYHGDTAELNLKPYGILEMRFSKLSKGDKK